MAESLAAFSLTAFLSDKLWICMAVSTAVLWGIHYAVTDNVVHDNSPWTVLFWPAIASICGQLLFGAKDIWNDSQRIFTNWSDAMWFGLLCATLFVANTLGVFAIRAKNALLAGFIEISYPLFTGFFTWLLFGRFNFTKYNIIGGFLILSGVMFISIGDQMDDSNQEDEDLPVIDLDADAALLEEAAFERDALDFEDGIEMDDVSQLDSASLIDL